MRAHVVEAAARIDDARERALALLDRRGDLCADHLLLLDRRAEQHDKPLPILEPGAPRTGVPPLLYPLAAPVDLLQPPTVSPPLTDQYTLQ